MDKSEAKGETNKINQERVSFIGISNWDIDASKQNRNLYVARPDLTIEDLKTTATNILEQTVTEFKDLPYVKEKELKKVIDTFSDAYFEFRNVQSQSFPHRNFHTLRDFYWLVKSFSQIFDSEKKADPSIQNIAARAIDINFAGIYNTGYQKSEDKWTQSGKYKHQSNFMFKQVYQKHFQNSWTSYYSKKSKIVSKNFRETSNVKEHIQRAIGKSGGRYLLLFVDKPLTTELLLINLQK